MSESLPDLRIAEFDFVAAHVRRLDPTATDAALRRYLAEIETMAEALASLPVDGTAHPAPFSAGWPDGEQP